MTVLEFARLVDVGLIIIGDLPLSSVNVDAGGQTRGEA